MTPRNTNGTASKASRLGAVPFAFWGCILLALALALAACGSEEPETPSFQWDGPVTPVFYEISSADGSVEGWMLGTIHALPADIEWRAPSVNTAIDEADLLMVEIANLDDRAAISATFNRLAVTPGMGPLQNRITPDLHGVLGEMIERSDYEANDFRSTETWAAAIMLARVGSTGDPRNGVDRVLLGDFAGREIIGFETPALQLGIFDALPQADQRDLLEGTLREWDKGRSNPGQLMRAWLSGDEAALIKTAQSGIMADPELREALLVGRNERWFPTLIEQLEEVERPLVAVGAAHVVGENGLGTMLEKAGYTVTRVD